MRNILITLTYLIAIVGCGQTEQKQEIRPITVETTVINKNVHLDQSKYIGTVEENILSSLSFSIAGKVTGIYADEGKYVHKGERLATLDKSSYQQTYNAAKATLNQANDAYNRLEMLYKENSLPEIKWVEANTKLDQAKSAYNIAKKNLDDCSITAPFSGIIGKKAINIGETAIPGAEAMTLLDISNVKVRFPVSEQEISSITGKSKIEITVKALNNAIFTAYNTEKSAVANLSMHTYDVIAKISNNGKKLLPGMICNVTVQNPTESASIFLPMAAVIEQGDNTKYVWKVMNDKVVKALVTTGKPFENNIQILSGVEDGDRIVIKGMQKIDESTKINVK